MSKRNFRLALLLLGINIWGINALSAQIPPLAWALSTGGSTTDQGNAVTVDASGNVYAAGFHQNTADLDPSAAVLTATGAGIFLQKFNALGQLLWANNYGASGYYYASDLAIDGNGDLLVSGTFAGTIDFDLGAGVANLTALGSTDVFLLKLSPAGNFIWAKNILSSAASNERPKSMTIDHQNNIVVVGQSDGAADADPSGGTALICSGSSVDAFVAKYDPNGNYLWAYGLGANGTDMASGVTVDAQDSLTIVGRYALTVDFDPNAGLANLTANGAFDGFVLRFSAAGALSWARPLACATGNGHNCVPNAIATDAAGNMVVGGSLAGSVDLDPGVNVATVTSNGVSDMFVLKLDGHGNYLWAFHIGGIYQDDLATLCTDAQNNIYTGGHFEGTMDFDPGAGVFMATPAGLKDAAVCKFSASGTFDWAAILAGTNNDFVTQVRVAPQNAVLVTGSYYTTVDFDPNAGNFPLTSAGGADAYLYQLGACQNSPETSITDTACISYTWNASTYTTSGTYTHTLTNASGCDSIVILHLTIQPMTASISASNNLLTAAPGGGTYQWLDCDHGMAPIVGASNTIFAPTATGNYAVVVTRGDCIDTTACLQFVIVGTPNMQRSSLALSPNPAHTTVRLASDMALGNVRILSPLGQTVFYREDVQENVLSLPLVDWPKGIYFAYSQEKVMRLIVQ